MSGGKRRFPFSESEIPSIVTYDMRSVKRKCTSSDHSSIVWATQTDWSSTEQMSMQYEDCIYQHNKAYPNGTVTSEDEQNCCAPHLHVSLQNCETRHIDTDIQNGYSKYGGTRPANNQTSAACIKCQAGQPGHIGHIGR